MGSCCWALGTCCLNCTKFTPTHFICFPQIALQGSNPGGGSGGQRGPRGRQQQLPDKSCQEAFTGPKQCLAGFRGPVSLPSKYPALEGPVPVVRFCCPWSGVLSGNPSSGLPSLPVPPSPALLLVAGHPSASDLCPPRTPGDPLFQTSCLPLSAPETQPVHLVSA